MPLITKELLEAKLRTWTLSSSVHKVLGFTDEQEATVKAELATLAELGVVDRDGARRGLKFRLAGITDPEPSDEMDDVPTEEDRSVLGYKRVKEHITSTVDKKSLYELLEWITNVSISQDPHLTSMTLAIKKLPDGSISLRTYASIAKLHEVNFNTPEAFAKFIQKSINPKSDPKKESH